jgi:hypothetical protein
VGELFTPNSAFNNAAYKRVASAAVTSTDRAINDECPIIMLLNFKDTIHIF